MARESAAQKKAREEAEAVQADANGAAVQVEDQADGVAAGLLKFVDPAAAEAEAQGEPEAEAVQADANGESESVVEGDASAKFEAGDRQYIVLVDSISLAPPVIAVRGEIVTLEDAMAQRLIDLDAVRPA